MFYIQCNKLMQIIISDCDPSLKRIGINEELRRKQSSAHEFLPSLGLPEQLTHGYASWMQLKADSARELHRSLYKASL